MKSYTFYFYNSDGKCLFTRRGSYASKTLASEALEKEVHLLNVGRSSRVYICSFKAVLTPAV